MVKTLSEHRHGLFYRLVSAFVLVAFVTTSVTAYAQTPSALPYMPAPTELIDTSSHLNIPLLKGIRFSEDNLLNFNFIIEDGKEKTSDDAFQDEASNIIKYFLASLTIPDEDLWVNLSPYEKDKIIPHELGQTEMGKDMLGEDYILKQLVASLTYPEGPLGKQFWTKVYQRAFQLFKTTKIPINTFNKVWIVPDKAVVYEDNDRAFIGEATLKVMLEEDYLAMKNNTKSSRFKTDTIKEEQVKDINNLSSVIMKEVVLPVLQEEINYGKNFALLRQMYSSLILATWFKKKLKETIFEKVYINKKKIRGVDADDIQIKEKIYAQYVEAYRKGVYDYVKKDSDLGVQSNYKRRYFSGGLKFDVRSVLTTQELKKNPTFVRSLARSSLRSASVLLSPTNKKLQLPSKETAQASSSLSLKKLFALGAFLFVAFSASFSQAETSFPTEGSYEYQIAQTRVYYDSGFYGPGISGSWSTVSKADVYQYLETQRAAAPEISMDSEDFDSPDQSDTQRLVKHAVSERVKDFQKILIDQGLYSDSQGGDGWAGPKTRAAVKEFQKFLNEKGYKIKVDGTWGQETQKAYDQYKADQEKEQAAKPVVVAPTVAPEEAPAPAPVVEDAVKIQAEKAALEATINLAKNQIDTGHVDVQSTIQQVRKKDPAAADQLQQGLDEINAQLTQINNAQAFDALIQFKGIQLPPVLQRAFDAQIIKIKDQLEKQALEAINNGDLEAARTKIATLKQLMNLSPNVPISVEILEEAVKQAEKIPSGWLLFFAGLGGAIFGVAGKFLYSTARQEWLRRKDEELDQQREREFGDKLKEASFLDAEAMIAQFWSDTDKAKQLRDTLDKAIANTIEEINRIQDVNILQSFIYQDDSAKQISQAKVDRAGQLEKEAEQRRQKAAERVAAMMADAEEIRLASLSEEEALAQADREAANMAVYDALSRVANGDTGVAIMRAKAEQEQMPAVINETEHIGEPNWIDEYFALHPVSGKVVRPVFDGYTQEVRQQERWIDRFNSVKDELEAAEHEAAVFAIAEEIRLATFGEEEAIAEASLRAENEALHDALLRGTEESEMDAAVIKAAAEVAAEAERDARAAEPIRLRKLGRETPAELIARADEIERQVKDLETMVERGETAQPDAVLLQAVHMLNMAKSLRQRAERVGRQREVHESAGLPLALVLPDPLRLLAQAAANMPIIESLVAGPMPVIGQEAALLLLEAGGPYAPVALRDDPVTEIDLAIQLGVEMSMRTKEAQLLEDSLRQRAAARKAAEEKERARVTEAKKVIAGAQTVDSVMTYLGDSNFEVKRSAIDKVLEINARERAAQAAAKAAEEAVRAIQKRESAKKTAESQTVRTEANKSTLENLGVDRAETLRAYIDYISGERASRIYRSSTDEYRVWDSTLDKIKRLIVVIFFDDTNFYPYQFQKEYDTAIKNLERVVWDKGSVFEIIDNAARPDGSKISDEEKAQYKLLWAELDHAIRNARAIDQSQPFGKPGIAKIMQYFEDIQKADKQRKSTIERRNRMIRFLYAFLTKDTASLEKPGTPLDENKALELISKKLATASAVDLLDAAALLAQRLNISEVQLKVDVETLWEVAAEKIEFKDGRQGLIHESIRKFVMSVSTEDWIKAWETMNNIKTIIQSLLQNEGGILTLVQDYADLMHLKDKVRDQILHEITGWNKDELEVNRYSKRVEKIAKYVGEAGIEKAINDRQAALEQQAKEKKQLKESAALPLALVLPDSLQFLIDRAGEANNPVIERLVVEPGVAMPEVGQRAVPLLLAAGVVNPDEQVALRPTGEYDPAAAVYWAVRLGVEMSMRTKEAQLLEDSLRQRAAARKAAEEKERARVEEAKKVIAGAESIDTVMPYVGDDNFEVKKVAIDQVLKINARERAAVAQAEEEARVAEGDRVRKALEAIAAANSEGELAGYVNDKDEGVRDAAIAKRQELADKAEQARIAEAKRVKEVKEAIAAANSEGELAGYVNDKDEGVRDAAIAKRQELADKAEQARIAEAKRVKEVKEAIATANSEGELAGYLNDRDQGVRNAALVRKQALTNEVERIRVAEEIRVKEVKEAIAAANSEGELAGYVNDKDEGVRDAAIAKRQELADKAEQARIAEAKRVKEVKEAIAFATSQEEFAGYLTDKDESVRSVARDRVRELAEAEAREAESRLERFMFALNAGNLARAGQISAEVGEETEQGKELRQQLTQEVDKTIEKINTMQDAREIKKIRDKYAQSGDFRNKEKLLTAINARLNTLETEKIAVINQARSEVNAAAERVEAEAKKVEAAIREAQEAKNEAIGAKTAQEAETAVNKAKQAAKSIAAAAKVVSDELSKAETALQKTDTISENDVVIARIKVIKSTIENMRRESESIAQEVKQTRVYLFLVAITDAKRLKKAYEVEIENPEGEAAIRNGASFKTSYAQLVREIESIREKLSSDILSRKLDSILKEVRSLPGLRTAILKSNREKYLTTLNNVITELDKLFELSSQPAQQAKDQQKKITDKESAVWTKYFNKKVVGSIIAAAVIAGVALFAGNSYFADRAPPVEPPVSTQQIVQDAQDQLNKLRQDHIKNVIGLIEAGFEEGKINLPKVIPELISQLKASGATDQEVKDIEQQLDREVLFYKVVAANDFKSAETVIADAKKANNENQAKRLQQLFNDTILKAIEYIKKLDAKGLSEYKSKYTDDSQQRISKAIAEREQQLQASSKEEEKELFTPSAKTMSTKSQVSKRIDAGTFIATKKSEDKGKTVFVEVALDGKLIVPRIYFENTPLNKVKIGQLGDMFVVANDTLTYYVGSDGRVIDRVSTKSAATFEEGMLTGGYVQFYGEGSRKMSIPQTWLAHNPLYRSMQYLVGRGFLKMKSDGLRIPGAPRSNVVVFEHQGQEYRVLSTSVRTNGLTEITLESNAQFWLSYDSTNKRIGFTLLLEVAGEPYLQRIDPGTGELTPSTIKVENFEQKEQKRLEDAKKAATEKLSKIPTAMKDINTYLKADKIFASDLEKFSKQLNEYIDVLSVQANEVSDGSQLLTELRALKDVVEKRLKESKKEFSAILNNKTYKGEIFRAGEKVIVRLILGPSYYTSAFSNAYHDVKDMIPSKDVGKIEVSAYSNNGFVVVDRQTNMQYYTFVREMNGEMEFFNFKLPLSKTADFDKNMKNKTPVFMQRSDDSEQLFVDVMYVMKAKGLVESNGYGDYWLSATSQEDEEFHFNKDNSGVLLSMNEQGQLEAQLVYQKDGKFYTLSEKDGRFKLLAHFVDVKTGKVFSDTTADQTAVEKQLEDRIPLKIKTGGGKTIFVKKLTETTVKVFAGGRTLEIPLELGKGIEQYGAFKETGYLQSGAFRYYFIPQKFELKSIKVPVAEAERFERGLTEGKAVILTGYSSPQSIVDFISDVEIQQGSLERLVRSNKGNPKVFSVVISGVAVVDVAAMEDTTNKVVYVAPGVQMGITLGADGILRDVVVFPHQRVDSSDITDAFRNEFGFELGYGLHKDLVKNGYITDYGGSITFKFGNLKSASDMVLDAAYSKSKEKILKFLRDRQGRGQHYVIDSSNKDVVKITTETINVGQTGSQIKIRQPVNVKLADGTDMSLVFRVKGQDHVLQIMNPKTQEIIGNILFDDPADVQDLESQGKQNNIKIEVDRNTIVLRDNVGLVTFIRAKDGLGGVLSASEWSNLNRQLKEGRVVGVELDKPSRGFNDFTAYTIIQKLAQLGILTKTTAANGDETFLSKINGKNVELLKFVKQEGKLSFKESQPVFLGIQLDSTKHIEFVPSVIVDGVQYIIDPQKGAVPYDKMVSLNGVLLSPATAAKPIQMPGMRKPFKVVTNYGDEYVAVYKSDDGKNSVLITYKGPDKKESSVELALDNPKDVLDGGETLKEGKSGRMIFFDDDKGGRLYVLPGAVLVHVMKDNSPVSFERSLAGGKMYLFDPNISALNGGTLVTLLEGAVGKRVFSKKTADGTVIYSVKVKNKEIILASVNEKVESVKFENVLLGVTKSTDLLQVYVIVKLNGKFIDVSNGNPIPPSTLIGQSSAQKIAIPMTADQIIAALKPPAAPIPVVDQLSIDKKALDEIAGMPVSDDFAVIRRLNEIAQQKPPVSAEVQKALAEKLDKIASQLVAKAQAILDTVKNLKPDKNLLLMHEASLLQWGIVLGNARAANITKNRDIERKLLEADSKIKDALQVVRNKMTAGAVSKSLDVESVPVVVPASWEPGTAEPIVVPQGIPLERHGEYENAVRDADRLIREGVEKGVEIKEAKKVVKKLVQIRSESPALDAGAKRILDDFINRLAELLNGAIRARVVQSTVDMTQLLALDIDPATEAMVNSLKQKIAKYKEWREPFILGNLADLLTKVPPIPEGSSLDSVVKEEYRWILTTKGTITKKSFSDAKLDADYIFNTLVEKGWLERVTDKEGRLIQEIDAIRDELRKSFPNDFDKIFSILQRSNTVFVYLAAHNRIEGKYQADIGAKGKDGLMQVIRSNYTGFRNKTGIDVTYDDDRKDPIVDFMVALWLINENRGNRAVNQQILDSMANMYGPGGNHYSGLVRGESTRVQLEEIEVVKRLLYWASVKERALIAKAADDMLQRTSELSVLDSQAQDVKNRFSAFIEVLKQGGVDLKDAERKLTELKDTYVAAEKAQVKFAKDIKTQMAALKRSISLLNKSKASQLAALDASADDILKTSKDIGHEISVAYAKGKELLKELSKKQQKRTDNISEQPATVSSSAIENTGGIDFNAQNMNLEVRGSGLKINATDIPIDLQNFEGFTFQIIKIERVDDVSTILNAEHPSDQPLVLSSAK